jgi:antitoxin component YwqK of YwqJK toxin-antitoxin module
LFVCLFTGTAVYFAVNGASEERTYAEGVAHGQATLFMTNGDTEERTYENGQLHGIATFVSHNGDRYVQLKSRQS